MLGVEITDPGSSYFELPPIVNFQDPCKKGYGAAGEALVDYDPNSDTYGQIIAVNIISEGENFPVPNNDANVIIAGDVPVGVIDTIMAISGDGYDVNNTTASDGNTEYNLVIEDGKILSARPIPKAPPSDFCNKTNKTRITASMMLITSNNVSMWV